MARGLILSSPTLTATCLLASFSITPPKSFKLSLGSQILHQYSHPQPCYLPLACCFSVSSSPTECPIDISKYREAFSRRMAMAGLKPHHRIALGVSGGPDSMALCVLTAGWKTAGVNAVSTESDGFIDGLLAIIVDHGLRAESKEEANIVCSRVSKMGIRCEIAHCDWPSGKPKQGQLQEAAREMRYQFFQEVCAQHQIGVLLIAHHADDQAELFILRLSRNSGVLGLAGMPFTSQIFPTHRHSYCDIHANQGLLLVRPLLEFSKEDMYKICQGGSEDWVEDPTNQSPLFTRNRIRMALNNLSPSAFKSELQAVISACRITRSYIDQICYSLLHRAVVIKDNGYAIIDLKILCPSKMEDICLMKFLSLVLQFISQRQRQIRGSALKLLMDYIRTFPCK
ncbi:tRN, partial [Sesbania bispinosa]